MENEKVLNAEKQIKEENHLKSIKNIGLILFCLTVLCTILGLIVVFSGTEYYWAFNYGAVNRGFGVGFLKSLPFISTFVVAIFSIIVIACSLIRIKSFIELTKINKEKDHLLATAYVEKFIESIGAIWMMVYLLILYFSLFYGEQSVNTWALVVSLIGIVATPFIDMFYWQIVYGKKYSIKFFVEIGIEVIKYAIVVTLLVMFTKSDALFVLNKAIASLEGNALYSKTLLLFLQAVLKYVFILFSVFAVISVLQEKIDESGKSKYSMSKYMFIGIICVVVDCVISLLLNGSTAWFTVSLGYWFEQARQWWIPVLLLFIAYNMSSLFPTVEEITKDFSAIIEKDKINKAKKKAKEIETQE